MKKRDRYLIPFQGLKEGEHIFDFEIEDSFFENLEYSELAKGNLKATVHLLKGSRHLELDISIDGFVYVSCDRCLDDYPEKVMYEGRLLVKYGDESYIENDEIWIVANDEHELDLTHYLYESINLSLPYRKVHPEDNHGRSTCNQEMIEKLNEHIVEEEKYEEINDPRWDKLKDLLRNN